MKRIALIGLVLTMALSGYAQYRFDKPLYGAAYYHEYMPYDRLDKDIAMMKDAGMTVVRVGESSWGLFEPQEGKFRFEWMDTILDKFHAAGIEVILGTPTYSIPAWLAHKHPEVLSEKMNGEKSHYGIRQNMDFTNPTYLFYSERIIRKMLERYAKHPAVIGYQVDNELEARGVNNRDYFIGFRNYMKDKFGGDLDLLTKEWGMNYWGMNINTWEEFYERDGVTSPSYKNEWERYNRKRIADFLNWQCDIVNEYKRPDQFVTHCFMPAFHNVDQVESFRQMEYPAINVYHGVQDGQDGQLIAYAGDYMRTVAGETNAQGTGWDSKSQYPPYDNQLRQNVYSHYASGANMVEYWHWATLHYGQETYWRGVIGHDLQPNRVYREFQRTARELEKIGSDIVNLKKNNKVAILYSHDSHHALTFMPYHNGGGYPVDANYPVDLVHKALYFQNIETDIVPCDRMRDFSKYSMLVIPPLYVADDSLLMSIDKFVKDGGYVVMMHKSGYCNEHSAVRSVPAPGPLRDACGFYYQEYSTIGNMKLKDNVFGLGDRNSINTWYEFLVPETAKPLAYGDHPFFGQWPVITENSYGKGKLYYIGAYPSQELLDKIVRMAAVEKGIIADDEHRFPVIMRSGVNGQGRTLDYVFNYSGAPVNVVYDRGRAVNLLTGAEIAEGDSIAVGPWDVAILRRK